MTAEDERINAPGNDRGVGPGDKPTGGVDPSISHTTALIEQVAKIIVGG